MVEMFKALDKGRRHEEETTSRGAIPSRAFLLHS